MKITVISTSCPQNFPLHKELAVSNFIEESQELSLFLAEINGANYRIQVQKIYPISLSEMLVHTMLTKIESDQKVYFVTFSVKKS